MWRLSATLAPAAHAVQSSSRDDFGGEPPKQLPASRYIRAGGLRWHVQDLGCGPPLLLLHGTGAAVHSWRDLAPLLATHFRVVMPDLPGHGTTSAPAFSDFSLPAMAAAVRDLLDAMGVSPLAVAGHSAGAAILVRMSLSGYLTPRVIISINGALLPLSGFPRSMFAPLANLLARSPLVARLAAHRAANTQATARLIAGTGSRLDPAGVSCYRALLSRPEHVAAALAMMANWNLTELARDLPRLRPPLKLLVANGDRTISPGEAVRVRALLPSAQIISLGDFGHLAHEETPQPVCDLILRLARAAGALPTDLRCNGQTA